MDDAAEIVQIRSYRVCFQLEHRIYRIDRWQIPLPYGVPLRGIVYFACLLVAVLVLARLPLLGQALDRVSPVILYFFVPAGGAYGLMRWKVDGRSALATLGAWARMTIEPKRIAAFRPLPADGPVVFEAIPFAVDERGARMRRGVVHGPARVTLRYPIQTRVRGQALHVRAAGDEPLWRGKQVDVEAGQRLVVE